MNRQVGAYRPQRRRGAVNALVQGAAFAYRNRRAAYQVGQAAKRVFTRKPKVTPKKTTYKSNPVIQTYGGGNDLTVRNSKATLHKRSYGTKGSIAMLRKQVQALMQTQIQRYQFLSNYDTNIGAHLIRNEYDSATGITLLPIHVYELSSVNNVSGIAPGLALGWSSLLSTANVVKNVLPTQTPTGGTAADGLWRSETDVTYPSAQQAFHNWSSIKLNLYGARKRSTRFTVSIMTVRDDFANFQSAGVGNLEFKQLLQYMARPLIYSNIQSDLRNKANKLIKVVKRYNYWVSASQTTDVDTTVGKIANANIFLRHNKKYDLDWMAEDPANILPHAQADGLDYASDSVPMNYPQSNQRLFMVITAFSPEQVNTADPVDPNVCPSYDIIIRNSWSFGRGI